MLLARGLAVSGALLCGSVLFADPPQSRGTFGTSILAAARAEAAKHTRYYEDYCELKYPGGDVPANTGVCTDLIVRSLRVAAGIDLQKELQLDMRKAPAAYPKIWDIKHADSNIDHRRCPNLAVWFTRNATGLTTSLEDDALKTEWQPGDIVFFVRPKATHPWHVAIVSDKRDTRGVPYIVDAFPPETSETHMLDEFAPIHSHYRVSQVSAR
jgi:uncharacterized protein YijF (DUF1287 family)